MAKTYEQFAADYVGRKKYLAPAWEAYQSGTYKKTGNKVYEPAAYIQEVYGYSPEQAAQVATTALGMGGDQPWASQAEIDLAMQQNQLVRTPTDEASGMVEAYEEAYPGILSLTQQYSPEFANIEWETQRDIMDRPGGVLDFYEQRVQPTASRISATAATAQRTADVEDVERLGGRAKAAFDVANPELAEIMTSLRERAGTGMGGPISEELERQALTELQAGAGLTDEEQRIARQQARATWSDRGLAYSDPAMADEMLNLYGAGRQRLGERRSFASDVERMRLQREQAEGGFMGDVAALESRTGVDPFMSILGRPVTSVGVGAGQQQFGAGFAGPGQQIFDPFSSYASNLYGQNLGAQQDIWSTGYNANVAQQIAQSNQKAALTGGLLSAGANILGSWIGG